MSEKEILYYAKKCIRNMELKHFEFKYNMTYQEVMSIMMQSLFLLEEERYKKRIQKFLDKNQIFTSFSPQKILFMADTHFGGKYENWPYFYYVLDFILNKKIKTVIHLGDVLDGAPGKDESTGYYEDQLARFLHNFPVCHEVQFYFTLGNHDFDFYRKGFDLSKIFEREREDFHVMSFVKAYVEFCEFTFRLYHRTRQYLYYIHNTSYNFSFNGHSHFFEYREDKKQFRCPCLCDSHPRGFTDESTLPGFLILEPNENLDCEYYQINMQAKRIRKVRTVSLVEENRKVG